MRISLLGKALAPATLLCTALALPLGGGAVPVQIPARPDEPSIAAAAHACPADLTAWQTALGAEWIDCHQVADLTTTGNPYTDPSALYGMGNPPPGSGTLHSKYSAPTTPPVSGLQIDGYFADGCSAYVAEPALLAKTGAPFIPGCTPPPGAGTCASDCHHDGQFVLRLPDGWDGHLLSTGTPGVRDAFASDYILSDYALEKGWAYVSQDKGNLGANFYRDACDLTGTCPDAPTWPGACADASTAWCPGVAIQEWTFRMRQTTQAARTLLGTLAPDYGLPGVTWSYVAGISNGGYQTRRALETDVGSEQLYDGGVDWEGTLFLPSLPPGVVAAGPATGYNLFTYLPTALANAPADLAGDPAAVAALAAVGFNPESQPLWPYHWQIYWGLTQKIYRLEFDPEYTGYTCSDTSGSGPSCVSPPLLQVPPTDPDARYDYAARAQALPQVAARLQAVANTGDVQHPLITLHGDNDALLPIKTDSDLYAQMVQLAGHGDQFRYYVVRGGNHVDPQFDEHYGADPYGTTVLRPMLPCVRAAVDALTVWVEQGTPPPPSHTIPRPVGATATQLANSCSVGGP